MFAAKYKTGSIAQVFSIAGKNLGRPIKKESLKTKKGTLGQTEERIYEYLKSIGIPERKIKADSSIGVVYTSYKEISLPDVAPLAKTFNPTFKETLMDQPRKKDIDPLNSLN